MSQKNITLDILVAELMLRTTVLETLLLEKGTLTKEDFHKTTEIIAHKAANAVLEKAKAANSLEDFTQSLNKSDLTKSDKLH
jgi:hypothetical protein